MKKQELYREYAKYYDLLYSDKNYKKESEKIIYIINKFKKSSGKELLDVACGTGGHLKYLYNRFKCTGLDINQDMLNIAKKKIPNIKYIHGNMINFKLDKEFDVITCLFSSIGYVKTYKNLQKTIKNFIRHLKVGGVVIINPWFDKTNFKEGQPAFAIYESKNLKIVRADTPFIKDGISILDFHYLIAERNRPIKYVCGRHELGLFDIKKTLEIMNSAGLKPYHIKNKSMKGRGLLVGVKL